MRLIVECPFCLQELKYSVENKTQEIKITFEPCQCRDNKNGLIDNIHFQEDKNWKKTEPEFKKGDIIKIHNMPNSDLIYEIMEEPEYDGMCWTYSIEDTLFGFKYTVFENKIVKRLGVSS